jgi:hypothetical protein
MQMRDHSKRLGWEHAQQARPAACSHANAFGRGLNTDRKIDHTNRWSSFTQSTSQSPCIVLPSFVQVLSIHRLTPMYEAAETMLQEFSLALERRFWLPRHVRVRRTVLTVSIAFHEAVARLVEVIQRVFITSLRNKWAKPVQEPRIKSNNTKRCAIIP